MEGKDFYFQMVNEASGTIFYITPKKYYDTEGCLSDESGVANAIVPKGFYELQESTYQFEGSSDTGKSLLVSLEMIEIDFGLHTPATPMNGNQNNDIEEEYTEEHEYDDLDTLLEDKLPGDEIDPLDYKNTSTAKLLRHIKMMLRTESFEEAEKIKTELHSRGVTEF